MNTANEIKNNELMFAGKAFFTIENKTTGGHFTYKVIGFKAFDWFTRHRKKLPENIRVYQAGRCMRCGRMLTTPESIQMGLGPEWR